MSDLNQQIAYAERILNTLLEELGSALPGIAGGVVVIVAFIILAMVVRAMVRRLARGIAVAKHPLVDLAAESAKVALIVVGLIMGFGTMGIDVTALVAGLGLTGFALGFALRDAVSNLLAGVLIILYQPFSIGDRITVAGSTGRVTDVDFRYTVLEAKGQRILVPNNTMFSNKVVVDTSGPEERAADS